MRFAYADPPYFGCGTKFYAKHHDDAGAFDELATHEALLVQLRDEFPDGWALSLSSVSLEDYLHLSRCVFGRNAVRIGAWVKPFHVFKKGVRPAYAWEPVLFRGGRNKNHPPPPKGGNATTPRDWVSANITLRQGMTGAKPAAVCRWLFDVLGMQRDDEFVDLFPGSGAVTRAWEAWRAQGVLDLGASA